MPSPALIDVNALLEPISEENRVGVDIRVDKSATSVYSVIKDARKAARAAERNNLFKEEGGDSSDTTSAIEHWNKVIQLAPKILTKAAKDLEIACWYTEALLRKSGFLGLREGLTVLRRLIEEYWDDEVYPRPDEEDTDEDKIETRVAAITGLNGSGAEGTLITPIRNALITDDVPPGPFNFFQYKQSLDLNRISEDDSERRSEQETSIGFYKGDFEKALEQSSVEFYVDLRDDLRDCVSEYRAIGALLDGHCGVQQAPPTSKIVGQLEEVLGAINHFAKNKFPPEAAPVETDENGEIIATGAEGGVPAGAVSSRAEAFRQLQSIADFFRQTEPHSPISYVIQKAVKWGDMSLDQLMNELIPDSSSRGTFSSLTGVADDAED